MEGQCKNEGPGLSRGVPKCAKKLLRKTHRILGDFWRLLAAPGVPKSPQKNDPKSHRKCVDFLMDFWVDFGTILGGEMVPESDPKIDKIWGDFLIALGSALGSKTDQPPTLL